MPVNDSVAQKISKIEAINHLYPKQKMVDVGKW